MSSGIWPWIQGSISASSVEEGRRALDTVATEVVVAEIDPAMAFPA